MKTLKEFIIEGKALYDPNKEIDKVLRLNKNRLPEEPVEDDWWDQYGWAYFDDSESYVTDGYGLYVNVHLPAEIAGVIRGVANSWVKQVKSKKVYSYDDTTDAETKQAGYNTYFWDK